MTLGAKPLPWHGRRVPAGFPDLPLDFSPPSTLMLFGPCTVRMPSARISRAHARLSTSSCSIPHPDTNTWTAGWREEGTCPRRGGGGKCARARTCPRPRSRSRTRSNTLRTSTPGSQLNLLPPFLSVDRPRLWMLSRPARGQARTNPRGSRTLPNFRRDDPSLQLSI